MVTVAEPLSDFKDLGPVIYQESKIMDNEITLLCVHDNQAKKFVNFEAYSFETGKVNRIQWDYMNFDSHFRFNAELMNPNNREGRYHWICERLAFVSDGKGGRKLELCEPTDDLPQIADKARNFKIPTGRMNYGDRARLRLEMERLPNKRLENIDRLEQEFKERFLKELLEAKELEREKVRLREEKIQHERGIRYHAIVEARRLESILHVEYADKDRQRFEEISEKENKRRQAAFQEIMNVLARHDEERKAVEAALKAQRKRKVDERVAAKKAFQDKMATDEAAELKREGQWNVRDDRLAAKAIRLQSDRNNALEAIDRKKQARGERQKELAHEMNLIRKALWDGHAVRDQKRKE